VKITVPKAVEDAEKKERSMWKLCPNCEQEVHVALRECSTCGFEWPEKECVVAEAMPQMKDVEFSSFTRSEPEWFDVDDWTAEIHESRKSKKQLGKITYYFTETEYRQGRVFMWLCFPDEYDGYAVQQSMKRWESVSKQSFPTSVDEFMSKIFLIPARVLVDMNGKYPELVEVEPSDKEDVFVEYEDDEIPF
jgi:hypothetical protein